MCKGIVQCIYAEKKIFLCVLLHTQHRKRGTKDIAMLCCWIGKLSLKQLNVTLLIKYEKKRELLGS
jgi:hypothetical protein